jgi:hypothetical protein
MWGQIAGAVLGGLGARKDRKNIAEMNRKNNEFYEFMLPYMKDNVDRVEGDYMDMYNTGAYTGDMFAPANDRQRLTNDMMYNYGMDQYNIGNTLMGDNAQFGQNTRDIYSDFRDMAATNAAADPMADASAYAQANMSPIVQALMRDDKRRLEEQYIPTINLNASGTGNTNASRTGVQAAIERRGFDDRTADVSSDVYNQLRAAKLAEDNAQFGRGIDALTRAGQANQDIRSAYTLGADAAAGGLNTAFGSGGNTRRFDQEQMDADKALFDYNTGYKYNLGKDFGGFLSGSKMPVSANYALNPVSVMGGALGGATSGLGFNNQMGGGMGGDFFDGLSHSIGSLPIFDSFFPSGGFGSFV